MSARPSTLVEEFLAAAQGAARVVAGRKDAGAYFALTPRGLVGSLIALLLAIVLNLVLTEMIVTREAGLTSLSTLIGNIALYSMQILASWMVLRWVGKAEFFIAYVTVDNWVTFFLSVLLAIAGLMGLGGETGLVIAGLLTILAKINIARVIVGLRPLHIALLIIAQTFGGFIGLVLIGGLLTPAGV